VGTLRRGGNRDLLHLPAPLSRAVGSGGRRHCRARHSKSLAGDFDFRGGRLAAAFSDEHRARSHDGRGMKLAEFLAPSRTLVPLECDTLDAARAALLERLVASGAVADIDRLQQRVEEERGEDMVAIADRAFLLHYRTDTASSLQAAIGVARDGV